MELRYKLQVESFTLELFGNISGCLLNWMYTMTVCMKKDKYSFINHFRRKGAERGQDLSIVVFRVQGSTIILSTYFNLFPFPLGSSVINAVIMNISRRSDHHD